MNLSEKQVKAIEGFLRWKDGGFRDSVEAHVPLDLLMDEEVLKLCTIREADRINAKGEITGHMAMNFPRSEVILAYRKMMQDA